MSASFEIRSSSGSYEVRVAEGLFAETLDRSADAHIIADRFFAPHFAQHAESASFDPLFIEATEDAKSLAQMQPVIEHLRERRVNRTHHLVVIGGGIIQDIATFVASVYMRGLTWSYDPTTVLAMVDSCIGGKSSINVGPYKNLIGTFHPPSPVLIDPAHARTLPPDQFASGLIEAAKITFCRGPESFATYLAASPAPLMPTAALEQVVLASLNAKKYFIEIDEFDKKERLLLNFGHTFGHALEGASQYRLPHGIAVGLGILCSLNFQRARHVPLDDLASVRDLEQHLTTLIRTLPGLAEELQSLDLNQVLDRFASDKKHTTTHSTLILINSSGAVTLERLPRGDALTAHVRAALQNTLDTFRS